MTRPLRRLGFLTIGLFDPADPARGHADTLDVIVEGERLGFDSAWLRHRHLQFGISSPVAVMAAATQRTNRIELGTAVTPLGAENPFRLAEDLATVDVLSAGRDGVGRINPGFSVGTPNRFDGYKDAIYPDTLEFEEFGYPRLERLLDYLGGEKVSDFAGRVGIEDFSDRIEPHSPGLRDRVWYGAGSMSSATWAGEHGLNLLSSSVVRSEGETAGGRDGRAFAEIQRRQIDAFREAHPLGEAARVSQGLVVIPTDGATADQIERYRAYAAGRLPRTETPQGPHGVLFAPDLVGTSAEIAERLAAHVGFQAVDEVAFALPFTFEPDDYRQILAAMAGELGPLLGWKPSS